MNLNWLEGRQENGGSDTNVVLYAYSQAVCVSTYFWFCHASLYCLYTYSCNDSTLQVLGTSILSSMLCARSSSEEHEQYELALSLRVVAR